MSGARLVFFAIAWILVWGSAHLLLWRLLIRDPALPRLWTRGLTAAMIAVAALVPLVQVLNWFAYGQLSVGLSWPAFVWMGFAMYALLAFALLGLAWLARRAWRRGRPAAETDPERRRFVARVTAGSVAALAAVTTGVGIIAGRSARIREVQIELERLPPALDGFTITQLSDIHAGLTVSQSFVADLVDAANRAGGDLVAITGDIADGSADELAEVVAPLADLRSRLGTFYVTGNHDYYSGVDRWLEVLRSLGHTVLRNQRVEIGDGDDRLSLAGIDDWSAAKLARGHGADLATAIADHRADAPLVLLAHQPRHFAESVAAGVDLQLSGHTHGGQVWPFHIAPYLQQGGYLGGFYRRERTRMYISNGSGYWGPPMRLAAPAEVTRLILRARRG